MCEFKVSARAGLKEKKVAEDIISAKIEEQELVLRDVLGSAKRFKGMIISEVDVEREVMTLTEIPVLPQILSFIEFYNLCQAQGKYCEEIESKWEEVKASGDELIRSLWKKYEKDERG